MTNPIIFYSNLLETATVTASSVEAGFPVTNLYDRRRYTYYKPGASADFTVNIDFGAATTTTAISILGHNLGTETALFQLKTASAATMSGSTTLLSQAFTSDLDYLTTWASAGKQYYQISITGLNDSSLYIGQIFLGNHLEMQRQLQDGYDKDARKTEGQVVISEGGQFLGASYKYISRDVSAEFRYLTQAWVTSYLDDFLNNYYLKLKPFIFVADYDNYPTDVLWLRAADNPSRSMPSAGPIYRHWTLTATGVDTQ